MDMLAWSRRDLDRMVFWCETVQEFVNRTSVCLFWLSNKIIFHLSSLKK